MRRCKELLRDSLERLVGFSHTALSGSHQMMFPPPKYVSHATWCEFLSAHLSTGRVFASSRSARGTLPAEKCEPTFPMQSMSVSHLPWRERRRGGRCSPALQRLSAEDKFDLILSHAVFEHLYMPWVVAVEIQKMLKVGGCVFILRPTFPTPLHERPWHFFQFSDMGLRALFNDALGFDLLDSGMSNPVSGYFASNADSYLRYRAVAELYCHSEILCRKRCEIDAFEWSQVSTAKDRRRDTVSGALAWTVIAPSLPEAAERGPTLKPRYLQMRQTDR